MWITKLFLQKVCTIDRTQIMALTLAIILGITTKKPTTERIQDTTQDIIRILVMVPAIQTITSTQTSMEGKVNRSDVTLAPA